MTTASWSSCDDERPDELGGRITVVEAGVDAGGVRPAEDRHGVDRIGDDDRDAAHAPVSQPGADGSGQLVEVGVGDGARRGDDRRPQGFLLRSGAEEVDHDSLVESS